MNQITSLRQKTELAYLHGKTPSPLGRVALEILAIFASGLHHLDPNQIEKTHWDDEYVISFDFPRASWATTDFNELTQLVVMAHDANVRIGICSPSMKTMRLLFHRREPEGSYSQRQETLEAATAMIRANYIIGGQFERPAPRVPAPVPAPAPATPPLL